MELIFDSVRIRAKGTKSLLNSHKFVIRRSEFGHVFLAQWFLISPDHFHNLGLSKFTPLTIDFSKGFMVKNVRKPLEHFLYTNGCLDEWPRTKKSRNPMLSTVDLMEVINSKSRSKDSQ